MPVCPKCGDTYGAGFTYCLNDGARLRDAAPGDAPLEGQVIEGRYKVLERLGEGGIGTVYRAERVKLGRLVAIKFLQRTFAAQPGFVRRFEREAMAMSRLHNVHCVAVIDFGLHQGAPYLVMEFVP